MKKYNYFSIPNKEKQSILEMHKKATSRNYLKLNLREQDDDDEKKDEIYTLTPEDRKKYQQAFSLLRKLGVSDENEQAKIVEKFIPLDKSDGKQNVAIMVYFYILDGYRESEIKPIADAVNLYDILRKRNYIDPIRIKDDGVGPRAYIGNREVKSYEDLKTYVQPQASKYPPQGHKEFDYDSNIEPLLSNDKAVVFDVRNIERCITLTAKAKNPTGKPYSYCIGQETSNQFANYRINYTSTFYYIFDLTKIFKTDENGMPTGERVPDNELKSSHMIVYDIRPDGKIELTDAKNTTGSVADFPTGQKFVDYVENTLGLKEFRNVCVAKPATKQEKEMEAKAGKKIDDLQRFANLSYLEKKYYIIKGHPLTDEQFFYLVNQPERNKPSDINVSIPNM